MKFKNVFFAKHQNFGLCFFFSMKMNPRASRSTKYRLDLKTFLKMCDCRNSYKERVQKSDYSPYFRLPLGHFFRLPYWSNVLTRVIFSAEIHHSASFFVFQEVLLVNWPRGANNHVSKVKHFFNFCLGQFALWTW